jgi:hypothetical protein
MGEMLDRETSISMTSSLLYQRGVTDSLNPEGSPMADNMWVFLWAWGAVAGVFGWNGCVLAPVSCVGGTD